MASEVGRTLGCRSRAGPAPEFATTSKQSRDDPGFFAGYSTPERFGAGWQRAAEPADPLALLPEVDGRRALDLGYGAGQLAHHLTTIGAAVVVGIDVSERMLALARAEWAHPRAAYHRGALEETTCPPARFDLVVSSLALHDVDDYRGSVLRIAAWLAPGGILVYSTEHPIFTARLPDHGWMFDDAGRGRAGLVVERVVESIPSEQWPHAHPQARDERRRPTFLLVRARKP